MLIKYGKSYSPILKIKQQFFNRNAKLLKRVKDYLKLYVKQPKRETCINCNANISGYDFIKLGAEFVFCDHCGHLNGVYQNTEEFCEGVYCSNGGKIYAESYDSVSKEQYKSRAQAVYFPKAEFLLEALGSKEFSFCELGAGTGYMLYALKELGVKNISGYDVSEVQIAAGNEMLGGNLISKHEIPNVIKTIEDLTCDVLLMIGTLEHLCNPRAALTAIKNNPHIKYFYFSVPMISPSLFFELVFKRVLPRQLSYHSHLYSERSIKYILNEFNFESVAEWRFGTDMADLYREVFVELKNQKVSDKTISKWNEMFGDKIDALQLEFDKAHMASEIHMLVKK